MRDGNTRACLCFCVLRLEDPDKVTKHVDLHRMVVKGLLGEVNKRWLLQHLHNLKKKVEHNYETVLQTKNQ